MALVPAQTQQNLPMQGAGQGQSRGTALARGLPYQLCQDRQKDDNGGRVAGKLREQGDDNCDEDDSHRRRYSLQGVQAASYPDRQTRLLQKGKTNTLESSALASLNINGSLLELQITHDLH